MEYDKSNLILDFARRTKKNLEFVEACAARESGAEQDVYEVTQLVNSLLGLLVFPQQEFYNTIPALPLTRLVEMGWPNLQLLRGSTPGHNLQGLVRYMRNGVSHNNIEFFSKDGKKISGLRLWNIPMGSRTPDWEIELTLEDLKKIVYKFIDLIEE